MPNWWYVVFNLSTSFHLSLNICRLFLLGPFVGSLKWTWPNLRLPTTT